MQTSLSLTSSSNLLEITPARGVLPFPLCIADGYEGRTESRRGSPKLGTPKRNAPGDRVLLLGRMRELTLYRAEVLKTHGYRVLAPATTAEARAAIRQGNFDVAVLSYTLPSDIVEELAQLIRESCPECPLVAISGSQRIDNKINPNETVVAEDGPAGLIEALRRVKRSNG